MVSTPSRRKPYLDFLRIFAAFLVIYLHTDGFRLFLNHHARPLVMTGYIYSSVLTTINVPTFFMVSGALLLGKTESYQQIFSVRIKRIAIILAAFSLLIYCVYCHGNIRLRDFVSYFLSATITVEYWYLYAYLGFLLSLPLLRKIARCLTDADALLLMVCAMLFQSVVPALLYLVNCMGFENLSLNTYFSFPFVAVDILFFPLMGYYLDQMDPSKFGRKGLLLAILLLFGGSLIPTAITLHEGTHAVYTANYLTLFKPTSTLSFFFIIKYLFSKIPFREESRFCRFLTTASSTALGIYLMDPIFRYYVYQNPIYYRVESSFLVIPYSICYSLLSVCCCGCITYLLKKMPLLKKLL